MGKSPDGKIIPGLNDAEPRKSILLNPGQAAKLQTDLDELKEHYLDVIMSWSSYTDGQKKIIRDNSPILNDLINFTGPLRG